MRRRYSGSTIPGRPKPQNLTILSLHVAPAKVTAVFESYWRFAAERQQIFFRRLQGAAWPWTDDPILGAFKFTNAYRASDRVSQYLIRHVIYRDVLPSDPAETVFRILLFKIFNKIETWKLLEVALGEIRYADYSFARYDAILSTAMQRNERICARLVAARSSQASAPCRRARSSAWRK
jgi:hypothetical protein